jgi:hypothetical protein
MDMGVEADIVDAVAEEDAVDEAEVDFTLQDHIDVDALNRLLSHGTATVTLEFELPDHTVTVHDDGEVLVESDNT